MRKDNKGYSLVEVLIVLAIMAIIAGLSMVTFNSANRQRAVKAKDNLVTTSKYAKSLVQAQSSEYCVAIMKSSDASIGYYAVIGTATGTSQAELIGSFTSEHIVTTEVDGVKYKKTDSNGYSLDQLKAEPTKAQNVQSLGNRVVIKYQEEGESEIEITDATPIIIKFSKYDGSVIAGAGTYTFFNKGSDSICSKVELAKTTGKFRKVN